MHALTISNADGQPVLSMQIPDIDPMLAVPAILDALKPLTIPAKPARRTRSDAGKSRTPAPTT